MNILFHGWEYPPNGGGVGVYMHNMARALSYAGHHVVVVAGRADGLPVEEEQNGVHVYRNYHKHEIGSRRVRNAVLSIAREHCTDLIEGADHLGDCASILRRPHPIPVLIKIHACQVIDVLQRAHIYYSWQRFTIALAKLRAWKQMRAELFSIQNGDLACVPSQRMLDELYRQGLKLPDRIFVLPNPVSIPEQSSNGESDTPLVLFVGRVEFLKGIQFLPSIMEHVLSRFPEARLEVVGPDNYARGVGSITRWLKKRFVNLADRVDFRGQVSNIELDRAYRRTWVVVVPSLWDNFPNVVLEAMVRGKAVVTSPHGGMPEMLADTEAPIEEPSSEAFAEAVVSLLGNERLRNEIGQRERNRCLNFYSPEAVAREYTDLLESQL